jgi:hypothetical protein
MTLAIEYNPTAEDAYHLKLALHRAAFRHPLLRTMLAGGAAMAVGGAMMASIGSPAWWTLALAGTVLGLTAWLATRITAPTQAKVEREFRGVAWLREPFRVEVDDAALRYEHGPYRSRAGWQACAALLETDHHLIVTEKRGPGALAYGLAKRELDRTPGGTAAWREFLAQQIRAAGGRVRTRHR